MINEAVICIGCIAVTITAMMLTSQQPKTKPRLANLHVTGELALRRTKLDYVIEGVGKPCLVIGSSIYYPRTFSQELRKHLRMTFVDLPWFAKKTDIIPQAYSLEELVADIERIRQKLNLDHFILVGHSIHGSVAFEYAKRHPEHVSRLVLIGAPNIFGNAEYDAATTDIWKTATPERQKLQSKNWQHLPDFKAHPELQPDIENYLAMSPKYWFNPTYDARWLWRGMTINADIFHHLYNDIFSNYRMFSGHPSVPVPTFVAVGKFDYIIPLPLWERYRSVPNLTLSIFEKCGHTPQLEEPREFDGRLLGWLAEKL